MIGSAIGELYDKFGEQLLQQNIRVDQGDKSTNASIYATCTGGESASFYHFNNGVTFLCERAQWDGFTRKLTLHMAQVVNGGQTVRVLHKAARAGALRPDVFVPARVITSQGNKEFGNNVAVNLNNQNQIEPSFLRSNDPRIIQLSHSLASLGWYLERRENEVEKMTAGEISAVQMKIGRQLEGHIIRLKDGIQSYVATFMREPEIAKKNPKKIFVGAHDGGYFENIFNDELTAERVLVAQQLAWQIDQYVKSFVTRKRRRSRFAPYLKDYRDYADLLGSRLVEKFPEVLDQIIPQCAVFLLGITFQEWYEIKKLPLELLIDSLKNQNYDVLNEKIEWVIEFAQGNKNFNKSWPTLMKSQTFFDQFESYIKGKLAGS